MSKSRTNEDIKLTYDAYERFLADNKVIKGVFDITQAKYNHPSSKFGECTVHSKIPYGNTTMECEMRNGDDSDYTLKLISDVTASRVLVRYDSDGPSHRNYWMPLSEQSVPTPHFHRFNAEGREFAYRTPDLENKKIKDNIRLIVGGFPYFCNHFNITADDGISIPNIRTAPEGTLYLPYEENDPNENIEF